MIAQSVAEILAEHVKLSGSWHVKGMAVEALDNGILSCADPKQLQQICDGLSAEKIDGLLRKWLRLLPHPFTGAIAKPVTATTSQSGKPSSH